MPPTTSTNNCEVLIPPSIALSLSLEIDEYMYSLPEFVAIIEENDKIIAEYKKRLHEECFSKSPYCKPGVLIETGEGKIELIGGMNASGGVCNDCSAVTYDTIIKRYAVVFDFEEVEK